MNPITLALLGVLGYRTYQGKGRLAEMLGRTGPGQAPGAPQSALGSFGGQDINGMLDKYGTPIVQGVSDLFKDFQQKGFGETMKSWIDTGPNQPVSSTDLEQALGEEKIAWLMQQTGLSRQELLEGLSKELPPAVDKLTPDGHLPTALAQATEAQKTTGTAA